jgi:dolichyl-phosphate beta-glucosyltransferase
MITSAKPTTSKSKVEVSIIIPVFNLEKKISASLTRIKEVLNLSLSSYELIVVDDGSDDNTLEILREQERLDSRIRVISYVPNKGKGYAVKTGVTHSYGRIIVYTDGDLEISPNLITSYIKEIEKSDLIIASKRHPLSNINTVSSRKFLSSIFNFFIRMIFRIKVKDTQCGLKVGKGDVLRRIFLVMLTKRYAFDVELLVIATALNLKIKEMPVEVNSDHVMKFQDILKMILDIGAILYRFRIKRWYQRQLEVEQPEIQTNNLKLEKAIDDCNNLNNKE